MAREKDIQMTSRSRDNRRISSLLVERRVSGLAMVVILSLALLLGIAAFGVHVSWVAAIVVLALGLGYVFANARQAGREVADQHFEEAESTP
jgi:hypothetical protein